jgi:Skp family chaperone for outer membrane proteins
MKTNKYAVLSKSALHSLRQYFPNEDIYTELAQFIEEWSQKNEIDMIIGSTEVVFLKDEHDVTEQVLEIIREKGLHV